MVELTINEQKAEFDERILDRWGNEFRFDHVKGLAEWLKNSVDAYIRAGVADIDQHVFIRFIVPKGRTPSQIEVIDFVGMTHDDIIKAFKRWGDPEAATRGKFRTYGGHGNGGKFYMRQMFRSSDFVAWRHGKLNSSASMNVRSMASLRVTKMLIHHCTMLLRSPTFLV